MKRIVIIDCSEELAELDAAFRAALTLLTDAQLEYLSRIFEKTPAQSGGKDQ